MVDQRRHDGSRQQVRRQHREHHRHCQRCEQVFRRAGQHEHRHEHNANAQCRNQGRQRDLLGAVQDGPHQRLSLNPHVAVHVLDFNRGVVHQNSDRQRQAAQRHHIDGFPEESQNDDGRKNGQRNRHANDQCTSPAPQEQQDHHAPSAAPRSSPPAPPRPPMRARTAIGRTAG